MSQQTQTERLTPLKDSPEKQKYQDQLSAVLNQSLTPENIDSYADDALDQLVGIVDKVVSDYQTGHPDEPKVSEDLKMVEDKAFSHYGLAGLDNVLDNVARLSNNLSHIDAIIANAIASPTVILGTDPSQGRAPIEAGDGSFTEKKLIARLKTILFVLQEDFNLDIEDTEQVKLTPGVMKSGMMRKETYYSVEIHDMNKTVIVCDEEGNITFVLNDTYLRENGISSEDINNLHKTDLTDLVKADPKVGLRIRYSNVFVDKLIRILTDDDPFTGNYSDPVEESAGVEHTYLYPKAPEGYLSKSSISKQVGASYHIVSDAILLLAGKLGEISKYKFGATTAKGYSPEQIQLITDYLVENDLLPNLPPEGYLSRYDIAEHFEISHQTVNGALDLLAGELGEVGMYVFNTVTVPGYSPEQIKIFANYLDTRGLLAERHPDGYLSQKGIADHLGTAPSTVGRAITFLEGELGDVHKYKFGTNITLGYSPEQIEIIANYLSGNDSLVDQPPEGYLSARGIANKLGISNKSIPRAITALNDELGEVGKYKFGTSAAYGYSPEQIKLITDNLAENNVLKHRPPEGYLSKKGIADFLLASYESVGVAIEALGDKLGVVGKYKFSSSIAFGYSPDQIEMITQYIRMQTKSKVGGAAISSSKNT